MHKSFLKIYKNFTVTNETFLKLILEHYRLKFFFEVFANSKIENPFLDILKCPFFTFSKIESVKKLQKKKKLSLW